jgi:hypothetical protein
MMLRSVFQLLNSYIVSLVFVRTKTKMIQILPRDEFRSIGFVSRSLAHWIEYQTE